MKTLLVLSVILCAALSIRAATVVPVEAAAGQEENKPAPNPAMDADAVGAAAQSAARTGFCLEGWESFRDKCYYLNNNPDTWSNAEHYCAMYDGSLASVHNLWEYKFLQRTVRRGGHTQAWIGGFYFQDAWRWEDGSAFNYYNWELESSTNSYQCLQLESEDSKGWSNHGCRMRFPFVCQVKPSC